MHSAEKLSITLPAEMVRVIRAKVDEGSYGSNSEVIREAMRGWLERDRTLAALDAAVARGIADADAGRVQDSAALRSDLLRRLADRRDVGTP